MNRISNILLLCAQFCANFIQTNTTAIPMQSSLINAANHQIMPLTNERMIHQIIPKINQKFGTAKATIVDHSSDALRMAKIVTNNKRLLSHIEINRNNNSAQNYPAMHYMVSTLTEYLDTIFTVIQHRNAIMSADTVAKVVLKMKNAIYKAKNSKKVENFRTRVSLENFRVVQTISLDENFVDENAIIAFDEKDKVSDELGDFLNELNTMSPEQIKDMRTESAESDIVWMFGCVLHFILFKNYPLDEWEPKMELDAKFNLPRLAQFANAKFKSKMGGPAKAQVRDYVQKYLTEMRELMAKLLESDEGHVPILAYEWLSFAEDEYKILFDTMKKCLQLNPQNRISLEDMAHKMTEIINESERKQ